MGSETSEDSDTIMDSDSDETKGPAYRACADSGVSMVSLAEDISYAAKILDRHYENKGYLDFDPGCTGIHQLIIPQPPRSVRKARDQLIDSAFKILELAAGPSGMISIAMSQVSTTILRRNSNQGKELPRLVLMLDYRSNL